jgi:BirA family biotin operon repressor/biotin-[acetyl-CoA-carboxylase] ligase
MERKIIGKNIISLLNVTSTNVYARKLLMEGQPAEGTLVIAGEQSQGKGYGQNRWVSQSGKNLTFTIILYPVFLKASHQFLISKAISLGIVDYLCKYLDDVTIKWPNDIYVDNYKIAGILIENDMIGSYLKSSLIGIGLNINQQSFPGDIPNPVSLSQVMEQTFSLKKEIRKLSKCLDDRYKLLRQKKDDKINRDYHAKLYRLREFHKFRKEGHQFVARIIGVSDFGQLILEDKNGKTLEFDFKEVEFVL